MSSIQIFLQIADVQAALNATFDGVSTYTVYGLTLQTATMQAACDYANQYVNGLIGMNITAQDMRFYPAKQMAIDVACIRALVIATGGSLVGAYDYFLGDLRVSRAGPFATAIKSTIEGFKEDLLRQVTNVSTPLKTADAQEAGKVPTYRGGAVSP